MIRSFDPRDDQFLADLASIQSRLESAQRQISSGLRVSRPSDDPDAVDDILQFQGRIALNQQSLSNLGRLKTEVDAGENALQTAIHIFDQATVLGSQGASSVTTAEQRSILALQVQGLLEDLVGLSQTQVEDRFIFSGDSDQSPAYQLNLTAANGVDRLFPQESTRLVQLPGGSLLEASKTAQEIFDRRNPDDSIAAGNAFAALNNLRLALENNDESAIQSALSDVKEAGKYLNQELAFYGVVQQRTAAAVDLAQKYDVQWKAALSDARDADLPAAAVELAQAQTQQEATLSAQSMVRRVSLFDFLG